MTTRTTALTDSTRTGSLSCGWVRIGLPPATWRLAASLNPLRRIMLVSGRNGKRPAPLAHRHCWLRTSPRLDQLVQPAPLFVAALHPVVPDFREVPRRPDRCSVPVLRSNRKPQLIEQ